MFRIVIIIITLLTFLQLFINRQISLELCYFYLFINILTFFVYAFDKSAAINNRWRVKELYLHVFEFFGGWWGALIAQQLIRHKSNKKRFIIVYSLTTFTNILLLFGLSYMGVFS